MSVAVGAAPRKFHRDGTRIACGCGSRTGGHVPPQPSPFPWSVLLCALCSAQGSAQAVPGALPMPQAKPSAFTFSCPGYFRFQILPSKERCFPQLLPFLILPLSLKPLSSPPPSILDTVQMERPRLAASETDNSGTTGLSFLPKRGESITGSRMPEDRGWSRAQAPTESPTPGTGAGKRCQPSASPPGASTTPVSRAEGINLCSEAICELSHSALHPAAC